MAGIKSVCNKLEPLMTKLVQFNGCICSDISKLLYVISRAVRRVKFETILKYHKWYYL